MSDTTIIPLTLPAQAAAEVEATIAAWHVQKGDSFEQGTVLAEAESAKSTFEFVAPCNGKVSRILHREGETVGFDTPVIEVETADAESLKAHTPVQPEEEPAQQPVEQEQVYRQVHATGDATSVGILGIGTYLPSRVVTNKELCENFPGVSEEYMFGVTGIRERRWATEDEKPSDMAFSAAQDALKSAGMSTDDIDAIIVSTTTPDVAMPATSCILQQKLDIYNIPCFDIAAACSGWLYGIVNAEGLIRSGIANNVLVVAVDLQSRMLARDDKDALFLFGDGAGATIVTSDSNAHRITQKILSADSRGLSMARREFPGYYLPGDPTQHDAWIRVDGRALFKFATTSFAKVIHDVVALSGWQHEDVSWVVPHQANARILKAAARKAGIPFEKFYLNIERVGNTSSASIPNALIDASKFLRANDKLLLCSVGAGITYAAVTIEW